MNNVRTTLLFGVLIAVAAALGLAVQQAPPESTVPSVDNPGPLGLRALYLYLREGGAPVEALRDSLEALPPGTRTLVIPAPEARPVSSEEVAALERFVRGGGTLVLLASHEKKQAQPALALWLELDQGPLLPTRERGLPPDTQDVGGTTLDVWLPAGALHGLNGLRVSRDRGITVGRAEAVPLAGLESTVGLWRLGMGQGEVYVAAGTDLAENRRLELLDNLRFWEALAARGPLLFDEFHHASAPPPPLSRGIWAFALQCLAVGALYAVSRGTRFGAPRPLQPVRHRSSLEYVASMGWLARRSRVERELLPELARNLRQLMLDRLGIPLALSEEEAARMLEQRCGIPAGHYLEAREHLARTLDQRAVTPRDYARLATRYARLEAVVTGRASFQPE
ncbi:DUF4350 domain-containing protein [Stigmatella sp. ncwal1]|uniref:DUF4350 domain-containing protein n=1 Tax=Stigmatella ashevillensis TaxID=2995309 RepID=A0ABT5D3A8_9BACT|nr:DUF4350 domain-containing protein [Stigmatella ashevillena]MDC0707343.1 DUF4350 domain-containing protein [Stigmatella ashevillena]